ncbi:MAG: class I tRNA ligase family protein, partial [Ilumatobacteraceae bacterium]
VEGASSARASLRLALGVLHRLFAPFLPFVTEEVWSWWHTGSVHRESWPTPLRLGGDAGLVAPLSEVVDAVRRAKSEAKLSTKARVASLVVRADAATIALLAQAVDDLARVGSIDDVQLTEHASSRPECDVTLAPVTGD